MSDDLRTWNELSDDAVKLMKKVQADLHSYAAGLMSKADYEKDVEAAIDVLATITGRLQATKPNDLEPKERASSVKAALISLAGLRILDGVHPDMWEARERFSVKHLRANGVELDSMPKDGE